MKIAIPVDNGKVAEHFGHCAQFMMVEIADGRVVKTQAVDNPGHKPGFLPRFLADQNVNLLIAGGIGSNAVGIFNQLAIDVIVGAQGKAEDVVEQYLKGDLESDGVPCPEHQ